MWRVVFKRKKTAETSRMLLHHKSKETFAKLQRIVFLSIAKNLITLLFSYVKILHYVQEDKFQCFAKVSQSLKL